MAQAGDAALTALASLMIGLLQRMPLTLVARVGRQFGFLAYLLDARHRKMATRNIQACLPDHALPSQASKLALENQRRIGESYCCAIKTASMAPEEIDQHLKVIGTEKLYSLAQQSPSGVVIVAIGHFGNFELYARLPGLPSNYRRATTYRGLRQPGLNRLMQKLRQRSGCLFFERRAQAGELRKALSDGQLILGLLADQHAGDGGLWLPFFGRECSTNAAPAVLALRYKAPLVTAICHRTDLAQWTVEYEEPIPTTENGEPRSPKAIMLDVNRRYEAAIRKDPANWFWVHNRWKPRRRQPTGSVSPQPGV